MARDLAVAIAAKTAAKRQALLAGNAAVGTSVNGSRMGYRAADVPAYIEA